MKLSTLIVSLMVGFFVVGCAGSSENMERKEGVKTYKPAADTSKESADQTDPTLIEGNLENNDFKN